MGFPPLSNGTSKWPARDLGILFFVALTLRLAICVWGAHRVAPTADGAFYHVVAQRIAAGHGYTWLWPDGVVTHAAHYPVGYPAMMAVPYWLFGAQPLWAMLLNALLGSLGVLAVHVMSWRLLIASRPARLARWSALVAAGALACSPTLVLYTPALMTESCVGALLVIATLAAGRKSNVVGNDPMTKRFSSVLGVSVCVAAACYLRPQSILMAPLLGFLMGEQLRRRLVRLVMVTVVSLAMVLPWTARNCSKMDHCAFVSANGGWNLLIGTFPEGGGAWVALDGERVPSECRNVFSETGKDSCFGVAGRRRILSSPLAWLSLIPDKLRATFDYAAAGSAHLKEAGAVSETSRQALMYVEFSWQRLISLLALLGAICAPGGAWPKRMRAPLLVAGAIAFLGAGAWWGWLVVAACLAQNAHLRSKVSTGAALGQLVFTFLIHALFFGAGRYSIPIWYAVGPLIAVGAAEILARVAWFHRFPGGDGKCELLSDDGVPSRNEPFSGGQRGSDGR